MNKPIIGSQYRPHHFENRTPTTYEALRPEISADAERLQRAMIGCGGACDQGRSACRAGCRPVRRGAVLAWVTVAAAVVGALVLAMPVKAETIGAHVGSWHSEPGYNNVNPGLYLRTDSGATVGAYRNSIRRVSTYAGWTWSKPIAQGVQATVTAGVITGYEGGAMPMAIPSVRFEISERAAIRVITIPKIDPKQGAHVVHLAVEWTN